MDLVSFGVGVAVGSVTLAVVLVYLSAWGVDRDQRRRDTATPQAVVCTACDEPFPDGSEARKHCRDVHNAPSDSAADHLLTTAAVEER